MVAGQIIFVPETVDWAEELSAHLHSAGYTLRIIATYDDAAQVMANEAPNAVIAVETTQSLLWFESLQQRALDERPLLILIQDPQNQADDNAQVADLVLPPQPQYIAQQLKTFLHLVQQNNCLRNHNNEIEILKNAIVRNVSHELRTPLVQVKSAIALIADGMNDRKVIDFAEIAMAKLEAHVQNITMLGSSLDPRIGPIVLRDAVQYAMRSLGRMWRHKNIDQRIIIELEDKLPPIEADKQGLSIVLQALLHNALKFSQGTVYVRAHREGDTVRIEVADDGIGIAENERSAIFQSFYQVDSSSTRTYGGMGIGLALVKLILELHNATITVESELDKGSRFSFALPIVHINASDA